MKNWQRNESQLLLFLKAVIFGLFLYIASASNFATTQTLFFVVIAFIIYLRPLFVGEYRGWYAFLITLYISIWGMKIIVNSIFFLLGIVLFSFIFYLILGIKEIFFIKRSRVYYIASLLILYTLFIIFFLADKSNLFLLKYSGLILATFLLFREWLGLISSFNFPKRQFINAALITFIISQMIWAVALLPLGFIAASNLMILISLIMGNLAFAHFTGILSKRYLIQHLVIFILLFGLILGSSMWLLNI